MAPKKAGKKKDEVVDLPKASTLPDGNKNYFIGAWSAYESLSRVSEITEIVRPRKEEDEAVAKPTDIFVLSGTIGTEGADETVTVSHKMRIVGISNSVSVAKAAAFEARGAASPAAAADGEGAAGDATDGGAGDAVAGEEPAAAAKTQRRVIVPDVSVCVASNITFIGVRPTVTVAPAAIEVKAAAPTKGKKQSDEDKAREAEERRQREEAALRAAKDEEQRLNKFAMPKRWADITVEGITFSGTVRIRQVHAVFKNCTFRNAAVEVEQYAKVSFVNCLFTQPAKNALYAFPLAELTVKSCVFSGLPIPSSVEAADIAFQGGTSSVAAEARNTVGIHTDSAKIIVDNSAFDHLGTGVLLRGKYDNPSVTAAPASPEKDVAPDAKKPAPPTQSVLRSTFDRTFVNGMLVDHATNISIQKNVFQDSDYYSLRLLNGGTQLIVGNKFAARVHIGKGCRPTLHSNAMNYPLLDENTVDSVFMEPRY